MMKIVELIVVQIEIYCKIVLKDYSSMKLLEFSLRKNFQTRSKDKVKLSYLFCYKSLQVELLGDTNINRGVLISVRHFGSTSCFAFVHLSHWFWNSFSFSIWRYINHVRYFLNEHQKRTKIALGKNPKFEIAITWSKIVQMSSSFAYMASFSVFSW